MIGEKVREIYILFEHHYDDMIVKNYKQKIDKKTYDESLARKGLDYYIPKAIETYNSKSNQFIILNKDDKETFKEIILKTFPFNILLSFINSNTYYSYRLKTQYH